MSTAVDHDPFMTEQSPTRCSRSPRRLPTRSSAAELRALANGELFEMARDGSEEAFGALMLRMQPLVATCARRCGIERDAVDDLAQEVWIRLFRNLGTMRDAKALPGWIQTTTSRLAWMIKRREGAEVARLLREHAATGDRGPEELLIRAAESADVRRAFEALDERDRCVIRLTVLAEPPVPYTEIATELGCAVGSIGAFRMRSLSRLNRSLSPAAGGVPATARGRHTDTPVTNVA